MKKFKRIAILLLAVTLVLGLVPAAPAAGLRPGPGPVVAEGGMSPVPLMSLGLSDQQLTQIRELRQKTYNETRNLRIQMMDTKFALSQLKLQKNVDQATVDAKIKELQDLRGQMQNNRLQARQKLQTILTPDQWNKLQSAAKERHHGCKAGDRPGPGEPVT